MADAIEKPGPDHPTTAIDDAVSSYAAIHAALAAIAGRLASDPPKVDRVDRASLA